MRNKASDKSAGLPLPRVLLFWLAVLLSTTSLPADEATSGPDTPGVDNSEEAGGDASRQRLREVIERLREHERLYADIDFTLRKSYRYLDKNAAFDPTLFQDEIERYVFQDRYFFIKKLSHSQSVKGELYSGTTTATFDGRRTIVVNSSGPEVRLGQPQAHATIYDSRVPRGLTIYPHTIAFPDSFWHGTLSEYFLRTRTDMDRPVRVRYVGEAEVDELRCETVEMKFFEIPDAKGVSRPMGGFMFWLAVDRNYVPIRIEGDNQTFERRISEMFELAPGVWFPRRAENLDYAFQDGQRKVRLLYEYETLRAELNPAYPEAFFQKVNVPYEARVFEIHDGEVTRTYVSDQRYPAETESLTLQRTETDDRLPTSLRRLQQLRSLDLWGAPINGPGLAALSETPRLRSLTLNATPITDAGLEHLRHVPELDTLQLDKTKTSDAGLAHLAPLKSLRFLSLEQCGQITGVGLKSIDEAAPLADLRLTGCSNVGDAAMAYVGRFRSLTHLFLSGTAVGDNGLARLSALENLEYLQIENCSNVSDEGLAHLNQCPRLQSLFVGGCSRVTDEGVARLQAARPNCRIRR